MSEHVPEHAVEPDRERPSVARSIVTTALSNLALPLSALVTAPILARVLEPEGRGELAAILAPLALVALVGSFGLAEAITYVLARGVADRRTAAKLGVALGVAAGALAGLVLALASPFLLNDYPDAVPVLIALALTLPVVIAGNGLRGVARGDARFDLINRERWFSALSRVVAICALAVLGGLTVTSAALATHATALVALLLLLPVVAAGARSRPVRPLAPQVIRYGLRSWVATLGGVLVLRLDQAVMVPLVGARQLGYYAVAVAVAELPLLAFEAVRDVIFATGANRQDPRLVARAARMVIVVGVPLAAIGALLVPLLVPLVFGDAFSPAVGMTQVLLAASVVSGIGSVFWAGLSSFGRPGLPALSQGAAAVATVILLLVLVPPLGAIGAAYTSLFAYALAATVSLVAMVRVGGLPARAYLVPRVDDVRDLRHRVREALRARAGE